MRIQNTKETATQKRNKEENGAKSTKITINPLYTIPDSTGINNTDIDNTWVELSTDDDCMDTTVVNTRDYDVTQSDGLQPWQSNHNGSHPNSRERNKEITIIFENSAELDSESNNGQI